MELRCYVDADLSGDLKTCCLRTGFLIFLNTSPFDWYSKLQNTVETDVFGSEFVAQKTTMEHLSGLRYKLHTMGITITVRTYIWGKYVSYLQHVLT